MHTITFCCKKEKLPDFYIIYTYYTQNVPSSSNGIGKAASPALNNNLVVGALHLFEIDAFLLVVDDIIANGFEEEENEST